MKSFITVLFRKQKKHLPKFLRDTIVGEIARIGLFIFLSAWILQGTLYMDRREAALKIIIDICIIFLLMFVGSPLWASFFIAHSLNFSFNGQLIAMYTHMGATNVKPKDFIEYTKKIQRRIKKCDFIAGAVAFGSISRGDYKLTSDLDIRISPKEGTLNWLKTLLWALKERILAFDQCFPLDMYVFDMETVSQKMRIDEPPIVFINNEQIVDRFYENYISFNDFVNKFSSRNFRYSNIGRN